MHQVEHRVERVPFYLADALRVTLHESMRISRVTEPFILHEHVIDESIAFQDSLLHQQSLYHADQEVSCVFRGIDFSTDGSGAYLCLDKGLRPCFF